MMMGTRYHSPCLKNTNVDLVALLRILLQKHIEIILCASSHSYTERFCQSVCLPISIECAKRQIDVRLHTRYLSYLPTSILTQSVIHSFIR